MADPKNGDLKVWWIPQIPGKAFEWPVENINQAVMLTSVLSSYDEFQFLNKIKPDYCNAGGLVMFEDGEWFDWYDEALMCDFDDYREAAIAAAAGDAK